MAEDNLTNQTPGTDGAADVPAGAVEEMSWENVETYQPVSTDANDSATVFAATSEAAPAPAPAPERQPVPTYMPASAAAPVANPGGPGVPNGGNPYAAAPGYGYGAPAPQAPKPSNGKAVGALVCGILAILFSGTIVVGIILGIVALVLAGQVVRAGAKDGKTTGAKVCGVIGIVFSVLSLIAYLILFAIGVAVLADYDDYYNYSYTTPHGSSSSSTSPDSSSSSDSPLAITEDDQAALAVAEMTMETLASDSELMNYVADKANDGFMYFSDGVSLEEVGVDPLVLAQWMAKTVVVDSSSAISLADTEEGTATVFLDVESTDMVEYTDEILELLYDTVDPETVDPDDMTQVIASVATAAMDSADREEFCSIGLDLTLQDGNWVVDRDSLEEVVDLMFCLNNY